MSDENKVTAAEVPGGQDVAAGNGASEPTLPADYKPLSKPLKIFYGVGDFGFNMMNSVENYYFVFFLTNCAMLDPVLAGIVSTVGSIIDAIVGWLWGAIINTIKPMRWGRYRSWLLIMPWIVPILFGLDYFRFSDNPAITALLLGLPVRVKRLAHRSRRPDAGRPRAPRVHARHVVQRVEDSVCLHLPARRHARCDAARQPELRPCGCTC